MHVTKGLQHSTSRLVVNSTRPKLSLAELSAGEIIEIVPSSIERSTAPPQPAGSGTLDYPGWRGAVLHDGKLTSSSAPHLRSDDA